MVKNKKPKFVIWWLIKMKNKNINNKKGDFLTDNLGKWIWFVIILIVIAIIVILFGKEIAAKFGTIADILRYR